MKTQHNIQIPEYMSENNTKTLHQSQRKKTLTSRLLTLLTMVTMLSWANSAWADSTIKEVNGTTTIWDFSKVTEAMCSGLSDKWTKNADTTKEPSTFYCSNASGSDELPAFMDGLTVNICGSDKSRVYYSDGSSDAKGYCFNGASAYIIIPVTPGKELAVYSAQQINSSDVTLTASGDSYVATIPEGITSVKILRNSGATYVTKIVLRDPLPTLDTSAEATTQDTKTPEGWNKVQLPKIDIYSDVTLPTEGDGALSSTANNRSVIQAAIDAANTAGGGIVRIPSGTWLSGPIVMKSNVVLHLKEGATLKAMHFGGVEYDSQDLDGENYPWNGKTSTKKVNNVDTTVKNYQMFISCENGSENVVVEGEGETSIIDGQGAAWWPNRDVLGTRPPLIRFEQGSKFLVRNIKLQNSPGVNLTLGNGGQANNFTVHDVTIKNPSSIQAEANADGYSGVSHNTDGIPVWGPYVNIYDCTIDTGDDNVVFDSYSHHGHVWNCTFKRGHGASFGSYTVGVHDIIYENITFQGTSQGFRIKTNRNDRSGNDQTGTNTNGAVKNIICRNSTMTGVTEPILITTHYESEVQDPANVESAAITVTTPEYHDILFQNITATNPGSAYSGWNHQNPIMIYGLPELYIHDITFDNVKIAAKDGKGAYLAYCDKISFINGTTITGTTTPVTTKYNVTNTIGGFKASNLALVEGKESQSLSQGDTYTLTKSTDYTTSLGDGAITFESSNTRVATVDEDGKITAVGAGTATITIKQASTIEYADKSVEVEVTVKSVIVQKLIEYESASTVPTGITLGGTTAITSVKIHNDTDAVNCVQLKNGYTTDNALNSNYITIKPEGGIKVGDVLSLAGFFNNSDDTKVSKVDIFIKDAEGNLPVLYTTNQFINGKLSPDDPRVDTYTFENDYDEIYLGRNGGTGTNLSKIVLTRRTLSGTTPSDLTVETAEKTMEVGDTYTIVHTTSGTGAITYESSDEAVATVSDAGVITAVAAGTAIITINQAADENYAAGSCEIEVTVEGSSSGIFVEKILYNTTFENWDNLNASTPATAVAKKTTDKQDLTFTLYNTTVKKDGTDTKFTGDMCTAGYLQTAKDNNNVPYIITSALNNITKFELVQAATGTGRGVTVYVKGDGDADWVELHNKGIGTGAGETLIFNNVNRTNCQIKIGTFAPLQNAYILSLTIYGNVEVQARSFTDFKIDYRTNPYTVVEPAEGRPSGVEVIGGTYHGDQHGYQNATMTVAVDGPVRFKIGSSQYTNKATVSINGGAATDIDTKSPGNNNKGTYDKFATWTYNVEAPATLTFNLGSYCPFIIAEACEFVPTVDVTYYNTDGKTVIGKKTVDGGSELEIAYGESDVVVEDGYVFRGWYDKAKDGKKVENGKSLTENFNIYAVATKREAAIKGSEFSYDLTKDYFYQEDHECITMTDGSFHDGTHGWAFNNNGKIQIPVSGSANIKLKLCQYGGSSKIISTNSNGVKIEDDIIIPIASDGTDATIKYRGPATTLTFTLENGGYIHRIDVENLTPQPTDLAIPEGKSEIMLLKNGTKELVKDEDYTTTSNTAILFSSSNTEVATVSDAGVITAKDKYGYAYVTLTHPATFTERETTVTFLVKVVAEEGQTNMPTATVAEDGTVTIVKSKKSAEGTKIYYTTDGSAPDENSTEYTAPFQVAAGTIVQAIAIDGNGKKSMSDVRQIYNQVPATITWTWDDVFDAKPEITGEAKNALNPGTKAVIGNKFNSPGRNNDIGGLSFVTVKPTEKANEPNENHTLKFNVVPLAGISFKPTAASFTASKIGTGGGKIDATFVAGSMKYELLDAVVPARNSDSPAYTTYPNATNIFTTNFSSIPMLEEEWALKLYVYSLDDTKDYGFRDITISGLFSGCEYDGNFYNVTASTNPAEGGTAEHIPSASRVMEGKTVTFTATSARGYKFTGWTNLDETTILGTSKTYVVDELVSNVDLEAHFVKLPLISFTNHNDAITGVLPEENYVDEETSELFIPYNYTLYREGWYLDHWTDNKEKYYPGNSYVFTENTTLTPVFVSSEGKKLTDINAVTTVKWNFDNKLDSHAAPTIAVAADQSSGPKTAFYTMNTNVGDTPVEFKMDINAETGAAKFDNKDARVSALSGYGCQINNDTKVTIPAVSGMKVTIKASNKQDTNFNRQTVFDNGSNSVDIIFGESDKGTIVDSKTLTYTYTGDESTLQILFNVAGTVIDPSGDASKTWGFYEYIEVEYPVLPDVLMENRIVTTPLLSDNELAVNAGVVTKSATTHANTGVRYKSGDEVTITAQAKYGYYISAIKSGETVLTMTKVEPNAEAENPTKATATYTVGAETGTVTVEYQRLPMTKVHIESEDTKLGDVDFASGSIHENFYSKGEGWVESWFVVGNTETAISIPADDYVIKNWTSESETGSEVATTNSYNLTVSSAPTQIYFAHFKHGEMGNVVFDITRPVIVEGTTIKELPANFGDNYDENSLAPSNVNNSYSFTIPRYHTVFKTGYTLKFWKNAANDNTYQLGTNHSFQTNGETITLIPVYEANPSDQMNRTNDPVMLYEFGTGKETRAQSVKLEKNTNTYWTAQVYVVTITEGQEHPHYRDVALHVNTGAKGFVRNGDLPEWASFGPGTTFDVASCVGTKVEILSYAPMSSTTFGGKPFTLVSSDEANHEYVYECTTELADARVPIVIGNDYSYYKYIKVYSKKANRVNLHIDVDSKTRGRITSVNAINTTVQDPIIELEDGGNSFHQGNSVKVTFKRRFGLEFDKIVDLDKIVNGEPLAVLEMRSDGKVNMVNKNNAMTVETVDANDDGTWGDVSDHVFYLKKTEPTPEEDMVDSLRTTYELSFNITSHRNLQVHFKEKPTYYVTYNAGKLATGVAPAAAWIEAGDTFIVPDNHTLYYEGNTLKYWIDQPYDATKTKADYAGHIYEIGTECINSGNDMLLYPVFEKNTFGLLDIPEGDGLKVSWPFASELGAPYINFERSSGILVSQLKKSSTEWIDLKIDLDGSVRKDANNKDIYGKFNNTSNKDRCQINNNSILSFPTTKDCVIGLSAIKEISTTEIAGMTDGNGYTKGKDVEAIYTGNDATQTVNFTSDGGYYSKFEVTYKHQNATRPQLTSVKYGEVTLDSDTLATLKSDKSVTVTVDPDVENDAIPEITATATNGEVSVSQATIDNRNAVITLKTAGGVLVETYTVDFEFNEPTTAPLFKQFDVNGVVYEENVREITVNNAPVSGTITLKFDRTMAETSIVSPVYQTTYSAKQGKDLVFRYWNLPVSTVSDLSIPASLFKDVYGKALEGDSVIIHLHVGSTSIPVEHRTFDYIVGKDGDINDAVETANNAGGNERYYIFVPDGEYELTGNQTITSAITSDGMAPADSTGVNRTDLVGKEVANHMTQITRANVSLIGQSTKGVTLFNRPLLEGISYTATIHIGKNATDFYAEDLQLVNRFPYWKSLNAQGTSGAGRAVAFWDQGNRSIMKNVEMWSYQDTYYSSNANDDFRGYFENCTIAGVVDFLCGDGNIWLEKCDIVLRDRAGNNISAPSQENTQQWGYVFNECNIKPEVDNAKDLKDKNWSLARPWANSPDKSPAATYLNTKMWLMPRDAGWEKMGTGAILRFHEYKTMDKTGTLISLGSRSLAACAPGAGSDDCILSAADASKYTIENVLGGGDVFTPRTYTQQIDAKSGKMSDANNTLTWNDDIELDDDRLQWNTEPMALCYFIFKKDEAADKWNYVTNVAQSSEDETVTGLSLEPYGRGLYCVRAANQRGGLGAPTMEVQYEESKKYVLTLSQVGSSTDGFSVTENGKGWSTICLPYNSKVPTVNVNGDTLKVYRGTIIDDFDLILERVTVINKNQGYVVCGPIGQYEFTSSSHTDTKDSSLSGNPNSEPIERGNNNGYVLSYKTTYGVGFYKYNGATIPANRAWLPVTALTNPSVGSTPNPSAPQSTRPISLRFANNDEATGITDMKTDNTITTVYDLQGRRINASQMVKGHIYIINGKKEKF